MSREHTMDDQSHQLIQSYVLDKWMVSTIHRASSACLVPEAWFYETIVWKWDRKTRARGDQVFMDDSIDFEIAALEDHTAICAKLMIGEPLEEGANDGVL